MLVEVKLNLLVRDVDTQLLKRILLEVFKSKDVQDSHIHAALCGTSKEEKGTNKLILLCYGISKSPAGILIDQILITIRVQPQKKECGLRREILNDSSQKVSAS